MATAQCKDDVFENVHNKYRFKLLIPTFAAGAIIGKGGEVIAGLQRETNTRIIMSKVRDYYPGTEERVCLINGRIDGILQCLDFIMQKCREAHEPGVERENQVKILVPNSTASMVIGERGNYIKQIQRETGAFVQVSQKSSNQESYPSTFVERCITITGDIESSKNACRMILEKIVEDPQSGSCSYVSYVDLASAVANTSLPFNYIDIPGAVANIGSPFANSDINSCASMRSTHSNSSNSSVSNVNQRQQILHMESMSPHPNNLVLGPNAVFIQNVTRNLRASGYIEQAVYDITYALTTLDSLGVLTFVLVTLNYFALTYQPYGYAQVSYPMNTGNIPTVPEYTINAPHMQVGFDQVVPNGSAMGHNSTLQPFQGSRYHHMFLTEAEAAAFDPLYSSSPTIASPVAASMPMAGNLIHPECNTCDTQCNAFDNQQSTFNNSEAAVGDLTHHVDIEVPETIVEFIIGQGGKVLVEIQQLSGANVQISKTGSFVPGTLNRIITITGSRNAVCTARSLIEQRVTEAKLKHGQQSAFEPNINDSHHST